MTGRQCSLTTAIVEGVADAEKVAPMALIPRLYDVIDPDAPPTISFIRTYRKVRTPFASCSPTATTLLASLA